MHIIPCRVGVVTGQGYKGKNEDADVCTLKRSSPRTLWGPVYSSSDDMAGDDASQAVGSKNYCNTMSCT
jgi:hypothetical protein